jgi:hypothetical protein
MIVLTKNMPLGITQIYNPNTNTTEISFCYVEDADIDYFILEYWDEVQRKYVPYDGLNGVIKKQR